MTSMDPKQPIPKRSLFMKCVILGGSGAACLSFLICDLFPYPTRINLIAAGVLLIALVIIATVIDNRRQGWQTIRFTPRKSADEREVGEAQMRVATSQPKDERAPTDAKVAAVRVPWWIADGWTQPFNTSGKYSRDETAAYVRLWGMTALILFVVGGVVALFFESHDTSHMGATLTLLSLPVIFVAAAWFSQHICRRLWPDLLQRAGDRAHTRLNRSEP